MTNEEKEREAFRLDWLNRHGLEVNSYTGKSFWDELCVPGSVTWDLWTTWLAGRAALRAESEPVYQMLFIPESSMWTDCTKDVFENPTLGADKRILYTAPQTESKGG